MAGLKSVHMQSGSIFGDMFLCCVDVVVTAGGHSMLTFGLLSTSCPTWEEEEHILVYVSAVGGGVLEAMVITY